MKKITLMFVSAVLLQATAWSQNIIEFENENISKEEFKRVYLKNNSSEVINKSSVEEYLDLYINFKLKVKEAMAQKLDTVPEFIQELKGYRKQLASPYFSAENEMEKLKKEGFSRLQEEVKASHLLIMSKEEDSPEDTLKAYNKIKALKVKLDNGADFETIAKENSEDPSAKTNGGNLGYFTAFYMVYPFENAAYNTKVGKVSEIVKTRFGYHLLKVTDRRKSNGNMTAAHILVSTEEGKGEDADAKIKEIYKMYKDGKSFEELAEQFSDDSRSARNGGELPVFSVGKMIPEFEKVAYGLSKNGDVSEPFKTQYGWHIVKRINKEPLGDYETIEEEIERNVKKDSRSKLTQNAVMQKIQKQYGFKEKIEERDDFYKVVDTSYFSMNWTADKASSLNKVMFTIGEQKVFQKDFAEYLETTQNRTRKTSYNSLINNKYKAFKKETIYNYKDVRLESEYPEFKHIYNEYHDGILLFNLTDKMVWKKAVEDTTGIKEFYSSKKENYKWDKRLDATVYSCISKGIADQAKKVVSEVNESGKVDLTEINRKSPLNVSSEKKKFLKGDNEVVDKIEWKKGISENITHNGRVYFVNVKEVLEPTYKTLDDSRGLITSDYQNYLEKEWINALKEKYSYKVNKEVVNSLKAELNK